MHIHKLRRAMIGILVSVGLAAAACAQAPAAANDRHEKLLGSWNIEGATSGQGTFPALLTFTADGSVISAESPSPFESSGHGSWTTNDQGDVAYTFVALFGSQDGKNAGKLKVIGRLHYEAGTDSWGGPFTIDVSDASGQVIFADRGTFNLTRIVVEPLDE